MKLLCGALIAVTTIHPVLANTFQCRASKNTIETSGRTTPYKEVNFGGKIVKLGQQEFPNLDGCSFFCLGTKIYVYSEDTLLGIIDEKFEFHCPDKVLLNWIQPKPEDCYAADEREVAYIFSKVFYSPGY